MRPCRLAMRGLPLRLRARGNAMPVHMILTGDVNLMNVDDPAVPFSLCGAAVRRCGTGFQQP